MCLGVGREAGAGYRAARPQQPCSALQTRLTPRMQASYKGERRPADCLWPSPQCDGHKRKHVDGAQQEERR